MEGRSADGNWCAEGASDPRDGRFELIAHPHAGATDITPEIDINVGAMNGRIKRLTVSGPDGTRSTATSTPRANGGSPRRTSPGHAVRVNARHPEQGKPHTEKWTFTTITPTGARRGRSPR